VPATPEEEAVRQVLRERVRHIEGLSWEELDRLQDHTELVTISGEEYRVVSGAYWDMEEWYSGMNIWARAYAPHGWRNRFPYREHGVRGGPTDPVPERPAHLPPRRKRWFKRT
jgi:hypothetical protein